MEFKLLEQKNNNFPTIYFVHKSFTEAELDQPLADQIAIEKNKSRFSLKVGSVNTITLGEDDHYFVVLGEDDTLDDQDLRLAIFKGLTAVDKHEEQGVNIVLPSLETSTSLTIKTMVEMAHLSLYDYDEFRTTDKKTHLECINIISPQTGIVQQNALEEGIILGESNLVARRLVDCPPNVLNAEKLAEEAQKLGKSYGFDVEIIKEEKIKKLGMNAYMAVAEGSANRPHLIVMRYKGNKKEKDILGYVGKGLTYDSGGYNLKTAAGLKTMKTDMGGAAAVIGAMCGIARAKLDVNVVAVVAACENAISSTSYRPDDILTTMSGKTILCENTDAEGRFTLMDGITYIQREEGATKVVDIATLTGAAVGSLGDAAALTLSNDDAFYTQFENAAASCGERAWRMPMFKEYEENLRPKPYKIADYTNLPGGPGAITAGLLLKEFIEDDKAWIHVDIAPVAFYSSPKRYYTAGASGYGARTLYELAKAEQK